MPQIKYTPIFKEGSYIVANKYTENPNKTKNVLDIVIMQGSKEVKTGFRNAAVARDEAAALTKQFKKIRKKG